MTLCRRCPRPHTHLHRRPRVLVDDIRGDEAPRVRAQAQAAAIPIADHIARHTARAATPNGDAGHLIREDVVVDDRALPVLADQDARVAAVVYPIALDEGGALLEDGDARAPVAEDVVILDASAAALRDEHACY
mgnify:CR=1 FL=1